MKMFQYLMTTFLICMYTIYGCNAEHFGNEILNQETVYPNEDAYEGFDQFQLYPSNANDLQYVTKKAFRNWFAPSKFKDTEFYPAPERKRFFAFHPMARFRGIAMNGGGIPARGYSSLSNQGAPTRGFRSFNSFVPSYVASPAHPVPSESKLTSFDDEIEEPLVLESKPNLESHLGNRDNDLSGLNSMAPHRGSGGRNKISRFRQQ